MYETYNVLGFENSSQQRVYNNSNLSLKSSNKEKQKRIKLLTT